MRIERSGTTHASADQANPDTQRPAGLSADFDVALECRSEGRKDTAAVEAFGKAGLTWWIEALGWWRGDVEENRRRIRRGPPTG
jgi:hypothetical protein